MTIKSKIKSEMGGKIQDHKPKSHSDEKTKFDLRDKLISKVKSAQEQELERQKNRVKKYKSNSVLGSALDKSHDRSPSMNLISSDESILSDSTSASIEKKRKRSESEDAKAANG